MVDARAQPVGQRAPHEGVGAVRDFVRAYEDLGCDELVLLPTVSRLDQLERLADVVG